MLFRQRRQLHQVYAGLLESQVGIPIHSLSIVVRTVACAFVLISVQLPDETLEDLSEDLCIALVRHWEAVGSDVRLLRYTNRSVVVANNLVRYTRLSAFLAMSRNATSEALHYFERATDASTKLLALMTKGL